MRLRITRDVKALAECIIKICDAIRNLQDRVAQLEQQTKEQSK